MKPQEIFELAMKAAEEASRAYEADDSPYALNCGFAWVVVRPARGPFITFCKKAIAELGDDRRQAMKYGSKHWNGGWSFWCPATTWYYGQDVGVYEAAAKAFAAVLNEHGINATWDSRLD